MHTITLLHWDTRSVIPHRTEADIISEDWFALSQSVLQTHSHTLLSGQCVPEEIHNLSTSQERAPSNYSHMGPQPEASWQCACVCVCEIACVFDHDSILLAYCVFIQIYLVTDHSWDFSYCYQQWTGSTQKTCLQINVAPKKFENDSLMSSINVVS